MTGENVTNSNCSINCFIYLFNVSQIFVTTSSTTSSNIRAVATSRVGTVLTKPLFGAATLFPHKITRVVTSLTKLLNRTISNRTTSQVVATPSKMYQININVQYNNNEIKLGKK